MGAHDGVKEAKKFLRCTGGCGCPCEEDEEEGIKAWTPKLSRNQQRRERARRRNAEEAEAKKEAKEELVDAAGTTSILNGGVVAGAASTPTGREGCRHPCRDGPWCRYPTLDNEGQLRILLTHNAKSVMSLNDLPEWEEIEMGVDSGATEKVVGLDMLAGIETQEGTQKML